MKTVILGAGSLGCIIGGFLAEAGYDVTFIGRRRSHPDAIKENGLVITDVRGTHVIKVKAAHNPLEVEKFKLGGKENDRKSFLRTRPCGRGSARFG